MRTAVLLLLAVLASGQTPPPAAPPPPPPMPVEVGNPFDAPETTPRATKPLRARPAPTTVEAYRADPDFQYDRPQAKRPSLLAQIWSRLQRALFGFVERYTTVTFWKVVFVVGAVLMLGWVFARLMVADEGDVFAGRQPTGAAVLLDADDIAEVDLGARLAHALGGGDLREAVRVRYLLVLQALDASGALDWRRDKTNRQYVAEVAAARADLAAPFRAVTRAFDAVWYGERPVSAALYDTLAPLFDQAAPRDRVPA